MGTGTSVDALLAQGVARRDVDATHVVRVGAAEVAGERGELGGVDLLLAEHAEQGRLEELEAVGADLHALGEDGLLGGERVGRLEAVGAHGDLVLLRAELGKLGGELLARELGGVGDELVELLAERGGVVDGDRDALEVGAVGRRPCGCAGSCAPTRPCAKTMTNRIAARMTMRWMRVRRGSGAAARLRRRLRLVARGAPGWSRRRRRNPLRGPPFVRRLVGEAGLEPART